MNKKIHTTSTLVTVGMLVALASFALTAAVSNESAAPGANDTAPPTVLSRNELVSHGMTLGTLRVASACARTGKYLIRQNDGVLHTIDCSFGHAAVSSGNKND